MRTGNVLLVASVLLLLGLTGLPFEAEAQQRTLGPVLKIHTDPFIFDSVHCRIRRCIPISFENIGDTTLIVHNHDRLRRPFYTRIDTPIVLQPGEMKTFDLCYTPYEYTQDSQYVFFRADTRLPLAIAMVHDVSASMWNMMPDGKRRYEAAHDASAEFIGNLLDTLDIVDEGAIYTFDDDVNFELKQTWTSDTALLRAAIPGRPLGTATCIFDAISRTIDSMMTRVKMRVLILVTDGEDSGSGCGPETVPSVIAKARENNVRIYAITIGNINRAPLIDIVKASGGKEFNATESTDLLAIYREIAVDLSKNVSLDILVKGESVGPRIEFTPTTWEFDSVQVGETDCLEVLVRNGGNTWLLADSVRTIFVPPYAITGLDVDSIAPYQTVSAQVCFTPVLPLHYEVPLPYLPSPCEVLSDTLLARGNSYLLPRIPRKTPLLSVGDLPTEFDTTFCKTTECTNLELHNGSDTTVTVREIGPVSPPFSLGTTAPLTIGPGENASIVLCYRPPDAPRSDTLRLHFRADARVPQRIGLLFDRGQAMTEEFMPGLPRMLTSVAGVNDFIDGLRFDGGFTDAVTVASFDSAGSFTATPDFLTDGDSLRSALPDSVSSRISCVFDAVNAMLDVFDPTSSEPRSIMLFTAGEDAGAMLCGSGDASQIAARALALAIPIHCVQLGNADSTVLAQLSQSTGGRYLRPGTLLELILGLRDIENNLARDVQFERTIVGRGVTPILAVDADTLDFGAAVFDRAAPAVTRAVRVTNTGDAPMHLLRSSVAAPFSITSGPASADPPINPGQSALLEYAFQPRSPGVYVDTLLLTHDGCGQDAMPILLRARAVATFSDAWEYPLAAQSPPPLPFDTMSCGTEQCLEITFTADPEAATTVRLQSPLPPFYAQLLPDSMLLAAGASQKGSICYRPEGPGTHEQWLKYASDTRAALSAVFVLPSDRSSRDTLDEGLSFGEISRAARDMFAHWILEDASLSDEGALLAFDAEGMQNVMPFNGSPWEFRYNDPVPSQSAPGDLAAALNSAMDYAIAEGKERGFVFAIVNEASAVDASDAAALRDRAVREDIILAVAAVTPQGYAALAPSGDALMLDSSYTVEELQSFIYRTTQRAVEHWQDSVRLTGVTTAAELEATPLTLEFDTLRVGRQSCLPLTLRNSGNASLTVLEIVNPGGPAPAGLPLVLDARQEATVDICYLQSALHGQTGDLLLIFDGCGRDTLALHTSSTGVDTVGVMPDLIVRGRPGSVVRIPLRLEGMIPASYDVRAFALTLHYNRTMLYPLQEEIVSEGTLFDGLPGITVELMRDVDDGSATGAATYTVNAAESMNLDGSSGPLIAPPFLVLHGDAMETPLELSAVRVGDGLPATAVRAAGTFIADSLGFHAQRLIDASARYNASIIGSYPNPFNASATIAFALRERAEVRLTVHDVLGREVRVLDDGMREAGLHRAHFDAGGMPTGVYFYRLESGGVLLTGSMLYLK